MILVKEEFLTHEKTIRAMRKGGPAVVVMWLALKGYAARLNTGGFIPDEAIDDLHGAPRRPRVLLQVLVECGLKQPDGTLGSGLVDKVDHGWQLHDYDDHSTSQTDEELRREKARIKKQLQRDKKAEELASLQSRRGDTAGTERGTPRGQNGGHRGDRTGDEVEDVSRVHSRAAGPAPARTRARAGSQPSPAQPFQPENTTTICAVEPITGVMVVGGSEEPADPGRETMCPTDLVERLEANGTVKLLAEKLAAPIDSVRASLRSFEGYWTIGKGAGQRRTGWVGKARQWVVDQAAKPGGLPAPGSVAHAAIRERSAAGGLTAEERAELASLGRTA